MYTPSDSPADSDVGNYLRATADIQETERESPRPPRAAEMCIGQCKVLVERSQNAAPCVHLIEDPEVETV